MRFFVICTVRNASKSYKRILEQHALKLAARGHKVHVPHMDTKQDQSGLQICKDNKQGINWCDVVLIYYNPESTGTHFDMGMAFAMDKPIIAVQVPKYGEGKSFPRMLDEWQKDILMPKTFKNQMTNLMDLWPIMAEEIAADQ